eukprot:363605-Chlamydomonas_euryale.AAC.3
MVASNNANDVEVTKSDSNEAAIVGQRSPAGFRLVGSMSPAGHHMREQTSIISFARKLTRAEQKAACEKEEAAQRDRIASRQAREEEQRKRKRKPGRPPKVLALATDATAVALPEVRTDSQGIKKLWKNCDWFKEPKLLALDLQTVSSCRQFASAVRSRTLSASGTYHGTLNLTERVKNSIKRLASDFRPVRSGRKATLDAVPAARDEVVNVLKAMREADPNGRHAPHMLAANGEAFSVSSSWVHQFLDQKLKWSYRWVKSCGFMQDDMRLLYAMQQWSPAANENRDAICDTSKRPPSWEELVVDRFWGVKPELFYSMDATFVWFVPLGSACTYEESGAKSVTVSDADDQHGAIIPFAVKLTKLTGETVPMMVIYGGATQAITPGRERQASDDAQHIRARADAAGHVITASANHWMTEDTYKQWIEEIMLPDYQRTCKELDLVPNEANGILQIDVYAVHVAEPFMAWLQKNILAAPLHSCWLHRHCACVHVVCACV